MGEDPGCCMIGPEPLEELCDRLDKSYVAPVLRTFFEEVLEEANETGKKADPATPGVVSGAAACVTVGKMIELIRSKAKSAGDAGGVSYPLQSN